MDCTLRGAVPVCNVQRCLKELEQRILALEQEPHGHEEPSISDSESESDGDNERCETVGCHLAVKPIVQQKVKHEQPTA